MLIDSHSLTGTYSAEVLQYYASKTVRAEGLTSPLLPFWTSEDWRLLNSRGASFAAQWAVLLYQNYKESLTQPFDDGTLPVRAAQTGQLAAGPVWRLLICETCRVKKDLPSLSVNRRNKKAREALIQAKNNLIALDKNFSELREPWVCDLAETLGAPHVRALWKDKINEYERLLDNKPQQTENGLREKIGLIAAEKRFQSFAGLARVKRELLDQIARSDFEGKHYAASVRPRHLIFSGPAGTGKTQMALAYAELVQARGQQKGGRIFFKQATGLNGSFGRFPVPGEGRGGIVIIDEADKLAENTYHYYREEAALMLIDALGEVAHKNDRTLYILTGRQAGMRSLMAAYPTLATHFPRWILFPTYDARALQGVLAHWLDRDKLRMTAPARRKFWQNMAAARTQMGAQFANVRTLAEAYDLMFESFALQAHRAAAFAPGPQLMESTHVPFFAAREGRFLRADENSPPALPRHTSKIYRLDDYRR